MSSIDNSGLINDMKATRKAIAYLIQKITALETKIDNFTIERKQRWKDEDVRKRESFGR